MNGMHEYDPAAHGELLSGAEVRRILHVAKSTLPLWRKSGKLVGYKIGRDWRYPSQQPTLRLAAAALTAAADRQP